MAEVIVSEHGSQIEINDDPNTRYVIIGTSAVSSQVQTCGRNLRRESMYFKVAELEQAGWLNIKASPERF